MTGWIQGTEDWDLPADVDVKDKHWCGGLKTAAADTDRANCLGPAGSGDRTLTDDCISYSRYEEADNYTVEC